MLRETFGQAALEAGIVFLGETAVEAPRSGLILYCDPQWPDTRYGRGRYFALFAKEGQEAFCLLLSAPSQPQPGWPVAPDAVKFTLWQSDITPARFDRVWLAICRLAAVRFDMGPATEEVRSLEHRRLKMERSTVGPMRPFSPSYVNNRRTDYTAIEVITRHVDGYLEEVLCDLQFAPVSRQDRIDDALEQIARPVIVDPFPLREPRKIVLLDACLELCSDKGLKTILKIDDQAHKRLDWRRWKRDQGPDLPVVGRFFEQEEGAEDFSRRREAQEHFTAAGNYQPAERRELTRRGDEAVAGFILGERLEGIELSGKFFGRTWAMDYLSRHDRRLFGETMQRLYLGETRLPQRAAALGLYDCFYGDIEADVLATFLRNEENEFLKAYIMILEGDARGWGGCAAGLAALKLRPQSWSEAYILRTTLYRMRAALKEADLTTLQDFARRAARMPLEAPAADMDDFAETSNMAIQVLSAIDREGNEEFLFELFSNVSTPWHVRQDLIYGLTSPRAAERLVSRLIELPEPAGGVYSREYSHYRACCSNLAARLAATGDEGTLKFAEALLKEADLAPRMAKNLENGLERLRLRLQDGSTPVGVIAAVEEEAMGLTRGEHERSVRLSVWRSDRGYLLSSVYSLAQLQSFLADPAYVNSRPALLYALWSKTKPEWRFESPRALWMELAVLDSGAKPGMF